MAATPAAAAVSVATPTSLPRQPTLSPSPCTFQWADCPDADGSEASEVPVSQPDLEEGEMAPEQLAFNAADVAGSAGPAEDLSVCSPQSSPTGSSPRFLPRFRADILAGREFSGECLPPPPRGPPPMGQPRRIRSRIGSVGGDLLTPAGASLDLRLPSPRHVPSQEPRHDIVFKPIEAEGAWSLVRPAHWWRRDRRAVEASLAKRAAFLRRMRGKCLRCLSRKHRAFDCREPRVCWSCGRAGHLSRGCPGSPASPPSATPRHRSTPTSPLRSYAQTLMVPVRGDLSGRPLEDEARPAPHARPAPRAHSFAEPPKMSPERDVSYTAANEGMLASLRCYKEGVDDTLSEENERAGRMMLFVLREDEDDVVADAMLQQLVPGLAELARKVVLLDDKVREHEGEGNADPGAGSALLSDQGEQVGEKEAGQKFVMVTASPVRTGPGQQDAEVGAPLCPLSSFLAQITVPLTATILGTPATPLGHEMEVEAPSVWRSERLAKLHPKGANIEQLARETVARRLGSLTEEAYPPGRRSGDFLALLDVRDRPFSDQEVAAIDDLVLTVNKTKKKKKMTPGNTMVRQMPPGEA